MANDPFDYGYGTRLTVNQKTKIDVIKDSVPKPLGYLPPTSLPTWSVMALEQKLPMLPAPKGLLYFTRETLAKTILRKNSRYTTEDPLNQLRIPSDKYEVLHDPATRVDRNINATNFLKTEGHVNENGEVICSLKEFNRYRKYLATLYNDQVRKKVAEMDELTEFERETKKALLRQELYEKGQGKQAIRMQRIESAKQFLQDKLDMQRRRLQVKTTEKEQKMFALEQERKRNQANKTKEIVAKKKLQEKRQADKKALERANQKAGLYRMTLNDLKAKAQKSHVLKERKILHEKKLAEWFDAKIVSAAERLQRENEIKATYEHDLNRRAIKRQKHIEHWREGLPMRIANRKAEEQRLKDIVRKYAMRWLKKVREKLSQADDPQHTSLWYSDHKDCLKENVKFLYQKSGYEKLDDIVMSILKFKEALKKQLLAEEEEEQDAEEEDYK